MTMKYFCRLCPLTCDSRKNLDAHVKTAHLKIPDLECDQCNYLTSDRLAKFLKDIHEISVFQCFKCSYSTSLLWRLSRHLSRHEKDVHAKRRVWKGHTSNAESETKINLSVVNPKKKSCLARHLCGLCPDSLESRQELYEHLEEVHNIT